MPAQPGPAGSWADARNGLAGHPFGQPYYTFTERLRLLPSEPGGYRTYEVVAPASGESDWFAAHCRQLHHVHYLFVDGRFAGVRVTQAGKAALLAPQARTWLSSAARGTSEGTRVLVFWGPTLLGPSGQGWELEILSKAPLQEVLRRTQ